MTRQETERRLTYFFRTSRRRRGEVQEVVTKLQAFGPVVVIGGMIRDLALAGNRTFGSDVDFVIKPKDIDQFHLFMMHRAAKRNRFGGYGWSGEHWRIDVWPLQKTWAHEEGHVQISFFSDLLRTTFFDCDAIIYDLQSKNITAKQGYFGRLKRRELEVNLLANPNPTGNAVRALRYAAIRGFGWGPKLCAFMSEQIEECGWKHLQEREATSHGTSYIAQMRQKKIAKQLSVHVRSKNPTPFRIQEWYGKEQVEFGFESASNVGGEED